MVFFFLALFLISPHHQAQASSCCGGSPTSFVVPVNSESLSLNLSNSYIDGVGRAFNNSDDIVKWSTKTRAINALNFSGSYLMSERLSVSGQGGVHFSKFKSDQQRSSLTDQKATDVLLSLNYEALPEYTYHPYKPKIFTSLFLNLPFGQSIFEPGTLSEGVNVTGHSLWGVGAGVTVYKAWFPFMLNQQFKFLQLFSDELGGQNLSSYYDFSSSTRLTYALTRSFTGFIGVTWAYISQRTVNSIILKDVTNRLEALSSQSTTVSLGGSYSLNDQVNLSLSYADQTLIGLPRNVVLNRTYTFNINTIF